MNHIKFSTACIQVGLARNFSNGQGSIGGSQLSSAESKLVILPGTPPTAAQMLDMATWTELNTYLYAANISKQLIIFDYLTLYASNSSGVAKLNNSPYVAAVKSGIASFFLLYGAPSSGTMGPILCGTVTDAAGDGDLKLSSVEIEAGQQYRVQALSFAVPQNYTY